MKTIKYLFALIVVANIVFSCNAGIGADSIQNPYTYSDLYYQNLRDYKASDHSISFGWFAYYGAQNSLAVRFMGLPDSLDVCSLWGGIPAKENKDIWDEIRFVQKVKGTKMLCVAITRIEAETDEKDFKKAYNEAKAMPEGDAKEAALNKSIEMYGNYFLDQIFENDLDGFDADYEPEGDFLSGEHFLYFMNYLAKYLGPNPNITKAERLKLIQERYGTDVTDTNKLLCVDGGAPNIAEICNYFFDQAYDDDDPRPITNWPNEKVVYCCSMGRDWQSDMSIMYKHARYQPTVGRKGGFGAFIINRDYNVHENNTEPYKRFRECIQIQNPAIY